MEEAEAELGTSETRMGFPPYRRSHLRSQTYHTLVCILSHLSASSTPLHSATHHFQIPDNGSGRMEKEKQQKEPECSEFVGSDFKNPKDPVSQKEIQVVHETIEGVGDKGKADKMVLNDIELMMGMEEAEDSSSRCVEAMSMQANGFNLEQRLMDELELVVKGTEDLVCDNGLIPLNSGLDEKRSAGSEVELMDYKVKHVEFQHADVNKSGNADKLQVQGELNQLVSESIHPSLMVNVSTSTKGQTSASAVSTSSIKYESQQKGMELVKSDCAAMGSLPTTEEHKLEKEEQFCQKVAESMHLSLDLDMNMCEDGGLLDSATLEDKHAMWNEQEELEKLICANNATDSTNNPIEKADIEEGEISGDFGIDGNSFDMSSADSLIVQQKNIDEVQKPKNAVENIIFPCKIGNGEKDEGYESNSFIVNALQDGHSSGQVEPGTGDKNGIACGVEVEISQQTIKCNKAVECGSVLKPGNSKDRHIGSKGVAGLPTDFAKNQVLHKGLLEVDASKDHGNSSAVKQKVDNSSKKKRGPGSEEKKAKKKQKKRKRRAEMNRQNGVKRLKLPPPPIKKPKTIAACRHYQYGRCHEGDKCRFSHDKEPETKSKPCCHFARHSCMKGDDCPFDHQLSKYPCNNLKSGGSCSRGDACMFSHQVPTKQDTPTPSNVSRPELKSPLLAGNTHFSMPLNNSSCSPVLQNHISSSMGIHSHINAEHKVTNTVQKHPMPPPKGISFINVAKSSLPSPSTPKQGIVIPNKESLVQIGTCPDQSASGTNQTLVGIPKKLPAVTPKGINFLSFGKGSVCSFKSSISSLSNRENGIKLPQVVNFGLPEQASSFLKKDDYGKVSDGTKRNVPRTDLFSNELSDKSQSQAEGMKLNFPGGSSINDATTDNSQTSTVTSSMLLVPPFVSNQSSECLASGSHKYASNSSQRALLSTIAFAAEHESDIKMKCPSGASPVRSEFEKN